MDLIINLSDGEKYIFILLFIFYFICLFYLQEVGSIIGKKGEIVKRFREEVILTLVNKIYFVLNQLKLSCSK